MQDASLIFISGYKSGCAVVLGSALLLLVKGEGGGSWVRCSVRGSLVSWSPPLSRLRDATPNHMNIYERKLLQLRRFISSGQSCSAAQEVIVLHTILDVSGLNPATVDCLSPTDLSDLIYLFYSRIEVQENEKGIHFALKAAAGALHCDTVATPPVLSPLSKGRDSTQSRLIKATLLMCHPEAITCVRHQTLASVSP